MNKFSERFSHTRIQEGYCNICGKYGKLSKDHVPPKCAITLQPMQQKTITEYFDAKNPVKPANAFTGSFFKTICKSCNGDILSKIDSSIAVVTTALNKKVLNYISGGQYYNNLIFVDFDAKSFTRAMIGHILSATSVTDCLQAPVESIFNSPLKDFVLGKKNSYEDTHDLYYWFYPHKMHISAQSIVFRNSAHNCFMCVLHFYPIAFIVTLKGQGTFPAHSQKLNINDEKMFFNMTTSNMKYATFPFVGLKDDQLIAFSSGHTCVSYPLQRDEK